MREDAVGRMQWEGCNEKDTVRRDAVRRMQ